MKTIDEMTLDEFANLTVLLNSVEQHIAISGKSNEELIEMASDYWAKLNLDNPVATLIYELMERLEKTRKIKEQLLDVTHFNMRINSLVKALSSIMYSGGFGCSECVKHRRIANKAFVRDNEYAEEMRLSSIAEDEIAEAQESIPRRIIGYDSSYSGTGDAGSDD